MTRANGPPSGDAVMGSYVCPITLKRCKQSYTCDVSVCYLMKRNEKNLGGGDDDGGADSDR